ncbi:DUF4240 domain-containing protein [Flavobacterium azooxidireducens]|uniref:DUF4240 domain-containing protein n=1 Tax=Flavobacterium azooxidireducens TaxID=1871076 RepID=A0ABY4KEV0_9FLAO|nr:DUF4240 domain-containing protein [Flavobacterium azooxidireducens]UPQ79337.1 DUF4240 domain-containing protein [Flavobacterium azooxidireducens]
MSYRKFLDDWSKKYLRNTDINFTEQTTEEQWAVIRDNWIINKRYKELITFIVENWDSGNCDDFSRPFSKHLINNKELNYYKRLWKGIIRNRLDKLWPDYDYLKQELPMLTIEKIKNVDISGYNQFSADESIERTVAWRQLYIVDGINEFIEGLKILNDNEEIDRQTTLLRIVSNLEKPKHKPTTDKRKIDENLFWQLINDTRKISTDQYNFIDNLKSTLEAFNPKEMRNFDKLLNTKVNELNTWEHWALAYIVRRGCGDDEFDYFKVWAVSKGKDAFESIKEIDENQLFTIFDEDPQLEELYYLAEQVYEDKTTDLMAPVRVKVSELTGKRWDEDKIYQTFPKLCKLFNYD